MIPFRESQERQYTGTISKTARGVRTERGSKVGADVKLFFHRGLARSVDPILLTDRSLRNLVEQVLTECQGQHEGLVAASGSIGGEFPYAPHGSDALLHPVEDVEQVTRRCTSVVIRVVCTVQEPYVQSTQLEI